MHREDGVSDVPAEAIQASVELLVYYADMVGNGARSRRDDLTSALVEAEIDGDRLTDEEIIGFLFLMVVAGNETTTKLLANAPIGVSEPRSAGPRVRRPLAGEAWVEETLRYDTSSQILARPSPRTDAVRHHHSRGGRAAAPPRLGQPRRAGFEDPDAYRIGREIGSTASFGSGAHFCLGAHLARMEAQVALTELFKRISGYDVDEADSVRVHSSSVRGFAHLPIRPWEVR